MRMDKCHQIKRGADHGVFDVETKCNRTIDIYGKHEPVTWVSHEVPCRKCAKYLANSNPKWGLCELCGGKLLEHNFKKYGRSPKDFSKWDDDWE